MKYMILASLLLATPALAQQAPPAPPSQRAVEIQLNRELTAHQQDLVTAVQLSDQVAALTAQVATLTKERDALKAAVPKPDEPAK